MLCPVARNQSLPGSRRPSLFLDSASDADSQDDVEASGSASNVKSNLSRNCKRQLCQMHQHPPKRFFMMHECSYTSPRQVRMVHLGQIPRGVMLPRVTVTMVVEVVLVPVLVPVPVLVTLTMMMMMR